MRSKKKFSKNTLNKIVYISIIVVFSLLLICLVADKYLFSAAKAVSSFFKGCFGISIYGIVCATILICSLLLAGKKIQVKTKYVVDFAFMYLSIILLVQLITSNLYLSNIGSWTVNASFSDYLLKCYAFAVTPTFGGVFAGILVYPLAKISLVFAYVFLVVGLLITIFFATNILSPVLSNTKQKDNANNNSKNKDDESNANFGKKDSEKTTSYSSSMQKLYGDALSTPNDVMPNKTARETSIEKSINEGSTFLDLFAPKTEPKKYDTAPTSSLDIDLSNKKDESNQQPILPKDVIQQEKNSKIEKLYPINNDKDQVDEPSELHEDINKFRIFPKSPNPAPIIDADELSAQIRKNKPVVEDNVTGIDDHVEQEKNENTQMSDILDNIEQSKIEDLGINDDSNIEEENQTEKEIEQPTIKIVQKPFVGAHIGNAYQSVMEIQDSNKTETEQSFHLYQPYIAPPIDLLDNAPIDKEVFEEDFQENARVLEQTLNEFKIEAKVENIVTGPTVTRYELKLAPGISIKRITNLTEDLTRNLSAKGSVRLESTISGKDLFGIEVPNNHTAIVTLRSIIESEEFKGTKKGLRFALGIDIGGHFVVPDLANMPHLLVAGSTGTGKSVCLNSLIISLMYRYSPEELRFILIDPKKVEFSFYNKSPHLMIKEVITDHEKAITALSWAIDEMERRYTLFADTSVQNIDSYNKVIDRKTTQILPRIVFVVDELSELITYNKVEIENRIKSLSAKARAAGIHLVLATQRPSVDVITGIIKANLPARIALRVFSSADSRTILDQGGPEKLLGKGDMLICTDQTPKPLRLQGALITNAEVMRVLEFIRRSNEQYFDENIENKILKVKTQENVDESEEELDPLFVQALEYLIQSGGGTASISMLQRRFSIGYNRAGKIIEDMVQKHFISGFDGMKSRKVLISQEEFDELYK